MTKKNELYERLKRLPEEIYSIRNSVANISAYVFKEQPKLKHFICVLIECEKVNKDYNQRQAYDLTLEPKETYERITLGDSKYIECRDTFRIQPSVSIRRLRINIFCDLSRVKIDHIKCANVNLSASYENSPVAYFDGYMSPANLLTIECSVR